MKTISLLIAVCLSLALYINGVAQDSATVQPDSSGPTKEQVPVGSALNEEVENLYHSLIELREAGTRGMLSKEFQTEGGLSTPRQQTFLWEKCFLIKVDVKFAVSAQDKSDVQDKILSISKPYLATPVIMKSAESQRFDWLADIAAKVDKMREGCTKQDIEELFDIDGGIRRSSIERYRLKECTYVKIDAVFDESTGGRSPNLREMSKLYLEPPFID